MTIRIIATGGTFDKQYNPIAGTLGFDTSYLPTIIAQSRMTVPVVLEELFLLDSLDIQEHDRNRILSSCVDALEQHIVIVHGTDTMCDTAKILASATLDKTIVLTGSMVPYQMTHSDALFNFGCAIAAVQILPVGVYIVMNGQIFSWDDVLKNRVLGVFQSSAD